MTAIRLRPMDSTFAMILCSIAATTVNPFFVGSSAIRLQSYNYRNTLLWDAPPLIFPTDTGTMEPCSHSTDTGLLKETAWNVLFPLSVSPIITRKRGYLNIKVRCGKGWRTSLTYLVLPVSWSHWIIIYSCPFCSFVSSISVSFVVTL